METWSLLTTHARVLVCIAREPDLRLRDVATIVGITERSAYGIVTDLTAVGYVIKEKEGRRNRYDIQWDFPLREIVGDQRTVGSVLKILMEPNGHESIQGGEA